MKNILALVVTVAFASTTHAASIIATEADTVGVPGSKTVTLALETAGGETFRGFDATFNGPLGQISPIGMATVFSDLNGFFGTDDVSADSQFLFASADVLVIGPDESANLLTAAVSGLVSLSPPLPNPAPFVQLVLSNGLSVAADVAVELSFDTGQPEPFRFSGPLSGLLLDPIPEPTTMMLAGLGLIGLVGMRRRS